MRHLHAVMIFGLSKLLAEVAAPLLTVQFRLRINKVKTLEGHK
jgi:hypothetical protein